MKTSKKLKRELRRIWHQAVGLATGTTAAAPLNHQPIAEFTAPPPAEELLVPPASVERTLRPRCAVVSMVRNEANRAHEVMRHLCALFDTVVVVDHLSDDDTGGIVAGYDGQGGATVITLRSNEPGYYQSDYMTACTRALVQSGTVDWIFFLDFDEFLPFASRAEFHQSLVPFTKSDVIHGHWLNCVPDDPAVPVRSGVRVVTAETVSRYVKVAVNARRLRGREVSIDQGNHAVRLDGRPEPGIGERAVAVLHFPVVSVEQLQRKLREGVAAYDATRDGAAVNGFHWREMQRRFDVLRNDPALLTEIVLRYGEPLDAVIQDCGSGTAPRLPRRTFVAVFAQIASTVPAAVVDVPTVCRETLASRLGERISAGSTADSGNDHTFRPACYGRLPARGRRPESAGDDTWLIRAILAGTQPLEVVMPTAWVGHEPFLFSLMEVMRPRRYVELGAHAGHSFFTACQHYRSHGDYGEAVAIDLWEGDHQAGFYGEQVFQEFRAMLNRRYATCGRYIRGRFTEAAAVFESHSIDLLHIDGLHTYAAVRENYETWRPKLTDDGVILFHDTAEQQSDFGVWQFFDEVRSQATEWFNFRHGHGLGVLAFGDVSTPAVRLLRRLREDPVLFERHYGILGGALFQSRRADFDLAAARRRAA